jgi:hypothetical protein
MKSLACFSHQPCTIPSLPQHHSSPHTREPWVQSSHRQDTLPNGRTHSFGNGNLPADMPVLCHLPPARRTFVDLPHRPPGYDSDRRHNSGASSADTCVLHAAELCAMGAPCHATSIYLALESCLVLIFLMGQVQPTCVNGTQYTLCKRRAENL